eukprot:625199-Amphidinium_carterae.1
MLAEGKIPPVAPAAAGPRHEPVHLVLAAVKPVGRTLTFSFSSSSSSLSSSSSSSILEPG